MAAVGTSEFDVVKGRLAGIGPPALCNAQELPIVIYSQFYSFAVDDFVKAIPRPDHVPAADFEAVVREAFYRTLKMAGNGIGATRALTFVALGSRGFYHLIGEKHAANSSLSDIRVTLAKSSPDSADIRLKFVRRDTGFSEIYRMRVNFNGPFEFLDEALSPGYESL